MIKFISGFLTATIFFSFLIYFAEIPQYMTYDCRHLSDYDDVPDHVIKACIKLEERDKLKWERVI